MSIPIAGGAILIIALGLLYVHNKEKNPEQNEDPHALLRKELDPELQFQCDTTLMNNPRSDLHVDSITNSLHVNYAGVDPSRHKVHSKNSKDADGDSMHRTSLGHIIDDLKCATTTTRDSESTFIHQDSELKTKHRSNKGMEWPF